MGKTNGKRNDHRIKGKVSMVEYNKVILEGVDGAGKTTLAKLLQEKLNYKIVQGSSFEIASQGTHYMYRFMMDLLYQENLIIDRMFLSNYVYAQLYDKKALSHSQLARLSKIAKEDTLTVLLLPEKELVMKRLLVRGDDYVQLDDVQYISDAYSTLSSQPQTSSYLGNSIIVKYDEENCEEKMSATLELLTMLLKPNNEVKAD